MDAQVVADAFYTILCLGDKFDAGERESLRSVGIDSCFPLEAVNLYFRSPSSSARRTVIPATESSWNVAKRRYSIAAHRERWCYRGEGVCARHQCGHG